MSEANIRFIEEKVFSCFEEFYQEMGPSGSLGHELEGFVFRGQSSSTYKLLPSVLRYTNEAENVFQISDLLSMAKINNEIPLENTENEGVQIYLEYSLLLTFYKIANYSGLHVPCINDFIFYANKELFFKRLDEDKTSWLDKDLIELAALAQHYGVPTRLLDWSFDKYIALYFAVQGAFRRMANGEDRNDFFDLWAINYNLFQEDVLSGFPLKFIVPSYNNNKNLCAQKGVLSYFEKDIEESSRFDEESNLIKKDTRPLDELLASYSTFKDDKVLFRMRFPYSCAKETFSYLNKMGYSASRLFPGYKGVVLEMEEKKYIYG